MDRTYLALLATALLGMAGSARAQDRPKPAPRAAAKVELGARYTDEIRGFSLRPPTNVRRVRVSSRKRLVGWTRRDKATGAIRWTLEVLHVRQTPTTMPLAKYAKAIAKELAKSNDFDVASTEVGVAAGAPAMHFRGIWRGTLKLWRRQSWVRTAPNVYLVLNIAGPETDKARMDAVVTEVLGSLKLLDMAAILKKRAKDLKRGEGVLQAVTADRLATLLVDKARYFKVSVKGKDIGFLKISETMASEGKIHGLRIIRSGVLLGPKGSKNLIREELFASSSRDYERWRRIEETKAGINVVNAIKQKELLLLQISQPGKPEESRQKELPKEIRSAYLPQALGVIATRLIDRSAPRGFTFATYDAVRHSYEMRTIRVVGPEKIILGDKIVQATRLTDQMASDAPTANTWVDDKGRMLRMKTPDGFMMELTTRDAVIDKYAADLLRIDKLPQAVKDRRRYKVRPPRRR